jgi:DNA-binding transcriptional LysR family regulator
MDAADLRVFEAVARLGGMGRAAETLHTVQSNVTARIRRLEKELGAPLFHRHARGVEPTPAGRRLLPFAIRASRLLEDARRAALDDGTPRGSELWRLRRLCGSRLSSRASWLLTRPWILRSGRVPHASC